ncbi:lytic transglycosylase domain-containing protein [Alkalibacillus aidingensis]|uniref:lytic transglycosylase domain-containing protein n=1 Tax=Alkalibacillus aidingensis TaxID=2747607 RepID=UPI001661460C|nr:transglycosylase SLT domain-containing protein [Alkalibacillus aidingensis]
MNSRGYLVLFITIFVMTTAFIINNMYYEQTINELENENQQLNTQQELLQSNQQAYQEFKQTTKQQLTYSEWNEMEAQADYMVIDSDGHFDKSWALFLVQKAKDYEVDPFIVYELIKVETGETFDPELVGPATAFGHAYGLSQFMENTAPWIADMADLPYEKELLFDPTYSIELSVVYLDFLYDEFNNWDEALTAYHRGLGGLEQYKKDHGDAKSWYAVEIQEEADKKRSIAFANN